MYSLTVQEAAGYVAENGTEDSAQTTDRGNVSGDFGCTAAGNQALFHVTALEPVTFKTNSDILSVYDTDAMSWTNPCSELVLETDGELCVILPPMGDGEVFYIEMSSAAAQYGIEIVYDVTAGQYLAGCQTITEH